MYVLNGEIFDINVPQVVGENQYPAGWFDDADRRAELGIESAVDTPAPAVTDTQRAVIDGVDRDQSGQWIIRWAIIDLTPEQVEQERRSKVPSQVTRRQARQALLLRGLIDQVPAAIAAIADPTERGLADIEWQDSQVFERDRPLLNTLGAALGLNQSQLDDLFIFAQTL